MDPCFSGSWTGSLASVVVMGFKTKQIVDAKPFVEKNAGQLGYKIVSEEGLLNYMKRLGVCPKELEGMRLKMIELKENPPQYRP